MVTKLNFQINGHDIYIDKYHNQKRNNVLVGRKQGSNSKFIIISEELSKELISENREKIINEILSNV